MTDVELLNAKIDVLTRHVLNLQGRATALELLLAESVLALSDQKLPEVLRNLESAAEKALGELDDAPSSDEARAGISLAASTVISHVRAFRP